MEYLQVKNWSRFQHYKHRKPPWIRLYRDLLDDCEFHSLPIASRALAPMIWLLASDTVEGQIEYLPGQISFRIRMSVADFSEALQPLIDKGFVSIASTSLAQGKQVATPETETERETEKEVTRPQTARPVPSLVKDLSESKNLTPKQTYSKSGILANQAAKFIAAGSKGADLIEDLKRWAAWNHVPYDVEIVRRSLDLAEGKSRASA